jgi:hypothetical protein
MNTTTKEDVEEAILSLGPIDAVTPIDGRIDISFDGLRVVTSPEDFKTYLDLKHNLYV